jgi:hypothetical protein
MYVYIYKCLCTYVLMHDLRMYLLRIYAYIFVGTSLMYACMHACAYTFVIY